MDSKHVDAYQHITGTLTLVLSPENLQQQSQHNNPKLDYNEAIFIHLKYLCSLSTVLELQEIQGDDCWLAEPTVPPNHLLPCHFPPVNLQKLNMHLPAFVAMESGQGMALAKETVSQKSTSRFLRDKNMEIAPAYFPFFLPLVVT